MEDDKEILETEEQEIVEKPKKKVSHKAERKAALANDFEEVEQDQKDQEQHQQANRLQLKYMHYIDKIKDKIADIPEGTYKGVIERNLNKTDPRENEKGFTYKHQYNELRGLVAASEIEGTLQRALELPLEARISPSNLKKLTYFQTLKEELTDAQIEQSEILIDYFNDLFNDETVSKRFKGELGSVDTSRLNPIEKLEYDTNQFAETQAANRLKPLAKYQNA